MSKNILTIKEKLDELEKEYENASEIRKKDILIKIADVITPLCESETKSSTQGEVYRILVDLIFGNEKSILIKYLERQNKEEKFSDYLFKAVKNRIIDEYRKEKRMKFVVPNINDEENENEDEDDLINKNNKDDTTVREYEQMEMILGCLTVLIAAISHPGVMLSGRMDNESSREFMRLLCTERFTEACKQIANARWHKELKNSETTLLRSINMDFADHIQLRPCRSIEDFETVPYKLKEYFGITQSGNKELETPFDAKVYITFYNNILHKSISNSLISRKRKELGEILNSFLLQQSSGGAI